jgi:hypothetical protein
MRILRSCCSFSSRTATAATKSNYAPRYSCAAHLGAIVRVLPKAHTDHVGRNRNMLDFWKKSEKNDRFSLIVLGVCLVVLVAVVLTRL